MKLIYCPECHDIIKLKIGLSFCNCGESSGEYHYNSLYASISGKAIPIGIANSSFLKALKNQPEEGKGECFEAFVIPKNCPTITYEKRSL